MPSNLVCRINRVPNAEPAFEDGYSAEVELVNVSALPIVIAWKHHRMELFTFVVKNHRGEILAETYLGDRFPFRETPVRFSLAPDSSLTTPFHFRGVIPKELQQPGKYY